MYRLHFGLRHSPLSKGNTELWDDGNLAPLAERFKWLLESPGIGLLTGEPGVGKTAALRRLTAALNPHRYQVVYLPETEFGRTSTVAWRWHWVLNLPIGAPNYGVSSRRAFRNSWITSNSCHYGLLMRRKTCLQTSSAISHPF